MSGTSTSSAGLTGFGGLLAERQGAEVAVPIPATGVLTLALGSAAAVTLGSGTLRGIIYIDALGQPLDAERNKALILFLRAAALATVTVINNSAFEADGITPIPPEQRFQSATGDLSLDAANSPVFYGWSQALGDWRWFIAKDIYTALLAGDWNPLPLMIGAALDQLAHRVPRDATAVGVAADPLAPAAFADIPEMSIVYTPRGTAVWVDLHVLLLYTQDGAGDSVTATTRLTLDGVAVANTTETHGFLDSAAAVWVQSPYSLGRVKITGLVAGVAVTIAAQWLLVGGLGSVAAVGTQRRLVVEDVPWS